MAMTKNIVVCTYCGKDLGGFVFEHNCEKKANHNDLWASKKIGRRGKPKTEKWS
jgi:anaerobic ribonucleoside-triphosphate reductase